MSKNPRKGREARKPKQAKVAEQTPVDVFGSRDPRQMPRYFFGGATSVEYDTAVAADTSRQSGGMVPRMWYIDAHFDCADCGEAFVWSATEQRVWFEEYKFYVDSFPRQCLRCRSDRRHLQSLRREYDSTVAAIRESGTAEQKRWLIELVDELEAGLGSIPDGLQETRRIFRRQLEREHYEANNELPTVRGNPILDRCAEMAEVFRRGKSAENVAYMETCLQHEAVDVVRSALKKLRIWKAHESAPAILDLCETTCRDGDPRGIIADIAYCLAKLDTGRYHARIIDLFFASRDFWLRHYIHYFCVDIPYSTVRDRLLEEWRREKDHQLLHSLLKSDLTFAAADGTLIQLALNHRHSAIRHLGQCAKNADEYLQAIRKSVT